MAPEPKTPPVELEAEEGGRFRRPQRAVEIRRRGGWRRSLRVAARVFLAAGGLAGFGALAGFGHRWAAQAPLFRVGSRESVEVVQNQHVAAELVRDRFVADLGRSIFSVPLEERRQVVEEIPWVEQASVHRALPNRLRVYLRERTPVAFLRQGRTLWLVDAQGAVLPIPPGSSYDFPVLTGVPESLTPEERRSRVQLYREFLQALDSGGRSHSQQLSELDVSDPEDLRATLTEAHGALRIHFGRDRYQEKFESFLEHRGLWQKSGEPVRSVDLRYRGQIVLNPDPAEDGEP